MGDNAELIDLHVHTDRSDGSTAPGELVQQARALGIRALESRIMTRWPVMTRRVHLRRNAGWSWSARWS